jgi:hypothetical protein
VQRQTIERQAERVAELERETGELRAENRALTVSTVPQSAELTLDTFTWWRRGWIAVAVAALVILSAALGTAVLVLLLGAALTDALTAAGLRASRLSLARL